MAGAPVTYTIDLTWALLWAPVASAVVSSILLFFRLYRSTDRFRYLWMALWRGKRHLVVFTSCEAAYAGAAALAAASLGLSRPTVLVDAIRLHPLRGWGVFGAVMSIFGSRVISGALERLFPGVDGDGTPRTQQVLARLHVVASARDRALTALLHRYFEEADGQRQADDRDLRHDVLGAVGDGRVDLEDLHSSYLELCRYERVEVDPYLVTLYRDWRARSAGDRSGAMAVARTYIQYAITSGHRSALRATVAPDGDR